MLYLQPALLVEFPSQMTSRQEFDHLSILTGNPGLVSDNYFCPDQQEYTREIDEHKRTLLLVNKADLLPIAIRLEVVHFSWTSHIYLNMQVIHFEVDNCRQKWAEYFCQHNILFLFWSAKAASSAFEGKKLSSQWDENKWARESTPSHLDTKLYGRDELLARLQAEAEAIAEHRKALNKNEPQGENSSDTGSVHSTAKHVVVGFVGYPNVGKSSTINALIGGKRTGVTSTPGKTKHFQTLIISDELVLCDCPGLVFPSFSSSRHEMIASGVLPIDRMTEHREAVQVVANKVPRDVVESIYNITLPKPKPYEPQSRPPLASELLRAYCSSRGYVSSSGLPDETKAARQILKDYIDGKLPHFEMPPGATGMDAEGDSADGLGSPSLLAGNESDITLSDECNDQISSSSAMVDTAKVDVGHVLDDLESFDLSGELYSKNSAVVKQKKSAKTEKHHKKPQRKKDRSWRVGNDNGDGMPVVRVFQKPTVDLAAMRVSN